VIKFQNNRWLILILSLVAILLLYVVWMLTNPTSKERVKNYVSDVIHSAGQSKVASFVVRSFTGERSAKNYEPIFIRQTLIVDADNLLALTDRLVYQKGSHPLLFVRGTGDFSVDVKSFSGSKTEHIKSFRGKLKKHNFPIAFDTFYGFDKKQFEVFEVDVGNHNGWIEITVTSSDKVINIPVFIEEMPKNDILFVESTDTLKAYVSGASMRTYYRRLPQSIQGNFTRPNAYPTYYKISHWALSSTDMTVGSCNDHLINADLVLKHHLEKLGLAHSMVSDEFFDANHDLQKYRMIVLGAHNEYWTAKKVSRIKEYVEKGGSLLILGGNTAWRWVARNESYDLIWGDGILKTDARYEPFLAEILGSYYDTVGYDTYAPFKFIDGAGLLNGKIQKGREFGLSSNFEVCRDKIRGASGHETDKFYSKSDGFTVIAKGMNEGGPGGADVVYKRFKESNGQVLNFGSLSLWHRINDPVIENLILGFDKASRRG
jgi:hypothetical protein